MKVSEAIDRLKVGDEVWVKGKIIDVCREENEKFPVGIELYDYMWLHENTEISLTEPQGEKVEVKQCVAEFYEANKDDLNFAIYEAVAHSIKECGYKAYPEGFMDWLIQSSNNPFETLIRMKDGYIVKPKRWVVKIGDYHSTYIESLTVVPKLRYTLSEQEGAYKFTDKSKAEAVATLVEGSVEEVAE